MNLENRTDNILYDDDWKTVTNHEYYVPTEQEIDNEEPTDTKKDDKTNQNKAIKLNKPWLLIFQISLCIAILAAAFAIQEIDNDLFLSLKDWYKSQNENSLIITDLPQELINGIASPDQIDGNE